MLEEEAATETALRKQIPGARFVHIATHGFQLADPSALLSDGQDGTHRGIGSQEAPILHPGLLAGLALAGANNPSAPDVDDGILTALEVAELDLREVDLATLSACETGLGSEESGEGVIGLQRAFQIGGARSVLASLWEVDDEATRALMERFYENLWKKRWPKAEAL
ncbi:MAG: CHAT domain-containing protein [Arachnia sp.]